MKTLTFVAFIFYASYAFSQLPSLDDLRKEYFMLLENEKKCKETYLQLSSIKNPSQLYSAYKAVFTMAMARYTNNVITKWSYFNQGRDLLEEVIKKNPDNVEMRFLRITIQDNVPSILSYSCNIDEDKNFILSYYHTIPGNGLKENIRTYFLKSAFCSAEEKKKL